MRTVPQVSGKVFTRRLFRGDSCHGAFMATVTIKCPVNGDDVPTDVLMDVESYETAILEDNQIKCSSCNKWHQWAKKDTFLR